MTSSDPVSIYDAKTHFSRIVARAERGERVTITRSGRPVAQLIPYVETPAPRVPGIWKGKVRIGEDFDEFSPADDADWYGP